MQGISPRSETVTETSAHRVDERLVWVIFKKCFENIDFNWHVNLEEIWVISNGFEGNRV